jgi:hypothetical protein
MPKYDRHAIAVAQGQGGNAEVVILGEHTDAVFLWPDLARADA